ncbi:disulfide oxidoreductase [Bacillus sp. FJAT-45350]|uniref:disulfide oxidoreductase n=1 Tax=Bacillus sp. FJAT-45350 TaxID=2011014 RepID=UPI000BB7E306|nr:disulfide oxidoreductase [Bacillus sp. FJAT-45350]
MEKKQKLEQLLFSTWAIAIVATAGSLFFSEVIGFIPCELCWIQRIFMYPMVITLGIALWKKDLNYGIYAVALSGIGAVIAFYHYLLQKVPALSTTDSCGIIPCTGQYINWLGFITIPFLSFVAFASIFVLSIYSIRLTKNID